MEQRLEISFGQYTARGRKPINQDSCGLAQPQGSLLRTKGAALAVADGISSSSVSGEASATAVRAFLADYFSTPETWSVRESAQRVLMAINSWLYGRTKFHQGSREMDGGYVCTLSAVIIKGAVAHVFHVGDSRVYLLRGAALEQLTDDHRLWLSREQSYLCRAFGTAPHLEIDYHTRTLEPGDVLLLTTDGVHEHVASAFLRQSLAAEGDCLHEVAHAIAGEALAQGSVDNLSIQIARIEALPTPGIADMLWLANELPCPPALRPGMLFEDYRIVRQVHASHRSHLWLAEDVSDGCQVVVKVPSLDMSQSRAALERLLLEEWIARRVDNPHVQGVPATEKAKRSLYTVGHYIHGQTLAQWLADNPRPALETVRHIVAQIVTGLRALHRKAILHLDLRPHNILIDANNKVTLIDFGSAQVAGIEELAAVAATRDILGTEQYSAPEYLLGEAGSVQCDLFSLGVIVYQMLTGQLPYDTRVAAARSSREQQKLRYQSALAHNRDLPAWIDAVLHKAVHIQARQRYDALSEFLEDLCNAQAVAPRTTPSLLERHPLRFWQAACVALLLCCLGLLVR